MKMLAENYNKFRSIDFPRSPKDADLEDIFIDLIQYDEFIAGTIDRILKGEHNYIDKLYKNEQLIANINKYLSNDKLKDKDIEAAKQYLGYLQTMQDMLNAVSQGFH